MLYLKNFGLTHDPFGKAIPKLVDDPQMPKLKQHIDWLLQTKGVGVIMGEAGVGKKTAIRHLLSQQNPMQYKVFYQCDNHFQPFDIYSQFAYNLGLERHYRYANLWRALKESLLQFYDEKKMTPVWILDESQNLSMDFLKNLPAFLNFSFDSRDIIVILLLGTARLEPMLTRSVCQSVSSRIQFYFHWQAIESFERFREVVNQAFKNAGCHGSIISEPGMKLLHIASKGRLRDMDHLTKLSLQKATDGGYNHIPDDIIQTVIETELTTSQSN